jgi:hypothetical protein
MTKSNRRTVKKKGKVSTLALVSKKNPQKPEESEQDYEDRMMVKATSKLHFKKKRTKKEQEEYRSLHKELAALQVVRDGALARTFIDKDLTDAADRMYKELSEEYGNMTPTKRLFLDRLVSAWGMSISYERLFKMAKYKLDDEDEGSLYMHYSYDSGSLKLMKEIRVGMSVANDHIIRLSSALRDLSTPPLNIKAKNFFLAENQQINQGETPKDLEKFPESEIE